MKQTNKLAEAMRQTVLAEMKLRGVAQKEMAERMGLVESTLSHMLRDNRDLRVATVNDMAAALGVTFRIVVEEQVEAASMTAEVEQDDAK